MAHRISPSILDGFQHCHVTQNRSRFPGAETTHPLMPTASKYNDEPAGRAE